MSAPQSRSEPFKPSHKQALKIARKRLEKYVSIAPRLLVSDDPDNIHDLRVWSRRVQQITSLLFPKPRGPKSRKIIRSVRKLRRGWGACRNLDVTLRLLQEKADSAGDRSSRQAWNDVRERASELRAKEFARARRQLRRFDLIQFIQMSRKLFATMELRGAQQTSIAQSIEESAAEWRNALEEAKNTPRSEQLHTLRLAGKRLRYRLELLAEMGEGDAKSRIESLKGLQDQLGAWNDRRMLLQFVDGVIGRRRFRRDHRDFCRILKSAVENERRRQDSAIPGILEQAGALAQPGRNNRGRSSKTPKSVAAQF